MGSEEQAEKTETKQNKTWDFREKCTLKVNREVFERAWCIGRSTRSDGVPTRRPCRALGVCLCSDMLQQWPQHAQRARCFPTQHTGATGRPVGSLHPVPVGTPPGELALVNFCPPLGQPLPLTTGSCPVGHTQGLSSTFQIKFHYEDHARGNSFFKAVWRVQMITCIFSLLQIHNSSATQVSSASCCLLPVCYAVRSLNQGLGPRL